MTNAALKTLRTDVLEIAYEESGPPGGPPVVLVHGFPDDVRTWDGVVERLVPAGFRCIVPYVRGYGPTRFLDPATPRSGQQAALGKDLRDLILGLDLPPTILVGYDWGGRACCINAALWPDRVRGLVSITGYNIQDIAACHQPASAEDEYSFWYQWYFNTERGVEGLKANRREICRLLWRLWSPNWDFDAATFAATAAAFDNPDFVDVVIQSYRHRHQNAAGDPTLEGIERQLAATPPIAVPTFVLHGACDGVDAARNSERASVHFTGPYVRHVVPVAGHFFPREAPGAVADAVQSLNSNDF